MAKRVKKVSEDVLEVVEHAQAVMTKTAPLPAAVKNLLQRVEAVTEADELERLKADVAALLRRLR